MVWRITWKSQHITLFKQVSLFLLTVHLTQLYQALVSVSPAKSRCGVHSFSTYIFCSTSAKVAPVMGWVFSRAWECRRHADKAMPSWGYVLGGGWRGDDSSHQIGENAVEGEERGRE